LPATDSLSGAVGSLRMDVALTSPLGGLRSDSSLVLALLAAGMLLGLLAPSASASSFTIGQPTEKYAGKTYGQWSAAWWQWANVSEPNSPVTDAAGANCAVKQKGPVWKRCWDMVKEY
jgi:hypothetical protein